jgi:hypothetical protein
MGRKKITPETKRLTIKVQTRLDPDAYARLTARLQSTDTRSISELARRILSNQRIQTFTKDISLDAPLEELSRTRKELNAIGTNINQIVKQVHQSKTGSLNEQQASQLISEFKTVTLKIDTIFSLISQFGKKWLQK